MECKTVHRVAPPPQCDGSANNTRYPAADRAWEALSAASRARRPALAPGDVVRTNRILPHDTAREMLNVHLYFVKLFGCRIERNGIPLDVTGLADAIMSYPAVAGHSPASR
jgi:hypothetical protein